MKINITGNNLELTPAIKEYVEIHMATLEKLLTKYDADSVQAHVVVARTTNHHNHGDVYQADVHMTIPGKSLVAKDEASDARVAVDNAVSKLKQELIKHKEKSGH